MVLYQFAVNDANRNDEDSGISENSSESSNNSTEMDSDLSPNS